MLHVTQFLHVANAPSMTGHASRATGDNALRGEALASRRNLRGGKFVLRHVALNEPSP